MFTAEGADGLGESAGEVEGCEANAVQCASRTNNLGERITASPAISGNELICRTDSNLYCIGTTAGR
ncbi:MAG TPA: hypothetical protein VK137_04430 [Planctomycetaceae bacterium]|nr:hypothetical protein [Planctomycetaceae bacterium]